MDDIPNIKFVISLFHSIYFLSLYVDFRIFVKLHEHKIQTSLLPALLQEQQYFQDEGCPPLISSGNKTFYLEMVVPDHSDVLGKSYFSRDVYFFLPEMLFVQEGHVSIPLVWPSQQAFGGLPE
jgi:hypothetical protein